MAQKVATHDLHVEGLFSVVGKVCLVTGARGLSSNNVVVLFIELNAFLS